MRTTPRHTERWKELAGSLKTEFKEEPMYMGFGVIALLSAMVAVFVSSNALTLVLIAGCVSAFLALIDRTKTIRAGLAGAFAFLWLQMALNPPARELAGDATDVITDQFVELVGVYIGAEALIQATKVIRARWDTTGAPAGAAGGASSQVSGIAVAADFG